MHRALQLGVLGLQHLSHGADLAGGFRLQPVQFGEALRGHLLGGAGCSQLLGAAAAGPRNQQDDQRDTAAGDDSGRSRHKAGRDEWVQVIKLGEERG